MPSAGQTIKPQVRMGRTADACWRWLGPTTPDGHGKKTYCGRDVMAHRWIWEILFGPIPAGMVVFRTCDAKDCTNPAHLRMGSQADACRQSVNVVLLPNDVQDIRQAGDNRTSQTAAILADKYGCDANTVRDIWRGKTWGRASKNYGPGRAGKAQSA